MLYIYIKFLFSNTFSDIKVDIYLHASYFLIRFVELYVFA